MSKWTPLPGRGARPMSLEEAPIAPGWYWFRRHSGSRHCAKVSWDMDVLWILPSEFGSWPRESLEYTHYAVATPPPDDLNDEESDDE